jgi:hypothetical protein
MSDLYNPEYYYIDEIIINAIVFDDTENLTLLGSVIIDEDNKSFDCDYVCDFAQLVDLLLFAADDGDKIIEVISSNLSSHFDIPSIVKMKEIIGKPLKITGIILKIYQPHNKNEQGEWIPISEPIYYIDSIESKETFEESSEGHKYLVKQELSKYLSLLNIAYHYYSQLINLKFEEKKARKKSGLKNELLFRIAYFNYQLK